MKRLRTLVAATVAALTLAATVSPAGAGQWTDPNSWGSGTTIGVSHTNQGNVVGLWQLMLSTRYRTGSGAPYTPAVTGVFNTTTANYTKVWQAEHSLAGLTVDGIVGPNTWNAARFFHVGANPYQSGSWRYYQYYDTGFPGQVPLPFAIPYATWFFHACVVSGYSGAALAGWPAIALPTLSC